MDMAMDEDEEAGDDLGVGSCKMGRHLEQRESTGEKEEKRRSDLGLAAADPEAWSSEAVAG